MTTTHNSSRRPTLKWLGTHKRGLVRMAKRNNIRLQQMAPILPPFKGRSNPDWRFVGRFQEHWQIEDGRCLVTPIKSDPSPKTRFWRLSTLAPK